MPLLTEILTHSFSLCARDICEEGENHMLPPAGQNNLKIMVGLFGGGGTGKLFTFLEHFQKHNISTISTN